VVGVTTEPERIGNSRVYALSTHQQVYPFLSSPTRAPGAAVTVASGVRKYLFRILPIYVLRVALFNSLVLRGHHCGTRKNRNSDQSSMLTDIESLPFEKRLSLDTFLEGCISGQNRRVDFPFVEQQVQEFPLGIIEGQHH